MYKEGCSRWIIINKVQFTTGDNNPEHHFKPKLVNNVITVLRSMARKKVTEKNMYCNRREIINENMIAEFSAKKR